MADTHECCTPHDLPTFLLCQKYRLERDPEGGGCPGPALYCGFREGCLIWFLTRGTEREDE